ncbi:LPS biosynthesis rfbu related protein [Reticulibacter mediterranei]|uniref:LPS biosynthesis rfbu related protein n=1 Tax=Reticulibacter mediterranei TaxID=2778369 RepID=A0A8J3IQS6_9CHLR|nr:glycosyltransferase family 4 protein [Reticulibacter mediterranei]GHO98523.1 LPS biosynthesis rfbu related protein [Reticulibacter mediterranei]
MKILLVTSHFPPSVGGVEHYTFHLASGLQQTYQDTVVVVTTDVHATTQIVEMYQGLKVYRLPVMFQISHTPVHLWWYFALKKIMHKERPDAINAHQPVMGLGDVAAWAAGDIPFVLTYHAGTMKKQRFLMDVFIGMYETLVLPSTARKATHIVCVSRFVQKSVFRQYAAKTTIIPPGVTSALYRPDLSKTRAERRVLFIARHKNMYYMKGLSYLIEAIHLLNDVTLRVIGEKAEVGNAHVEFVGVKQGEALVEEMQQASVLVLPSLAHMESFGMVLIEAMACQTPVIGTTIGGIPEVIDDRVDGLVVPAKDARALAQAISYMLEHPEDARRMGEAGAAKVAARFTWESCVERTKKVVTSCIK